MSNYVRPKLPGATVFFTVVLAERGSDLLVQKIAVLREALRKTRRARPFEIDAWVVLPDHMHCVWTLPEVDQDYSTRWSVIKARFSREMPQVHRRQSHVTRREHGIWQRRFWEHHVRDEADYRAHVEYCWRNPIKHGLVDHPIALPFSSYHRDIARHKKRQTVEA
nr:transposase [Amylibacter sp.]